MVSSRSTSTNEIMQASSMNLFFMNSKFFIRLIFLTQLTFGLMQQNIIGEDCGFSAENLRLHSTSLLLNLCRHDIYTYVLSCRFLLFGPRLGEDKSTISWVTDLMWSGIKMLSQQIDGFEKLPADMVPMNPHTSHIHILCT